MLWWRRETPKRRDNEASRLLLRAALAVEALGLVVEGGALLDGDEALAAEGLAGLGDGREPATEALLEVLLRHSVMADHSVRHPVQRTSVR